MKREHFLFLGIILGGFSLSIPLILYANAQVTPTDRFFQKNFCQSELTLLNGINYTTGEELSYDSSGCPVSTKVIHRWNELSTSNQIIITSRMSTIGYADVTNALQLEKQP